MALGEGLQQVKSLSCTDVTIALCLNDIQDAKRRPEAEEATKAIGMNWFPPFVRRSKRREWNESFFFFFQLKQLKSSSESRAGVARGVA